MSGQSHTGTNLLPDLYGFVRIELIVFFFSEKYVNFIHRVLPTVRRMDKILGKVSPSCYSPNITVTYRELSILFRCPDSALH